MRLPCQDGCSCLPISPIQGGKRNGSAGMTNVPAVSRGPCAEGERRW